MATLRNNILNDVKKYARSQAPKAEAKKLSDFTELYFANMPTQDLNSRSIETLSAMSRSHLDLLSKTKPKQQNVRIFNPTIEKDGWESKNTVIQIVIEDMPFLVDSLRIALNRLGLIPYLIIHAGGLKVKYEDGHISAFLHHAHEENNNIQRVAPIYIEISRQAQPKQIKTIERAIRDTLKDVSLAVHDWKAMENELLKALKAIENNPRIPVKKEEVEESKEVIKWLVDNFTLLGCRSYDLVTKGKEKMLKIVPKSGLGVLRSEEKSKQLRPFSDLPKEALALAHSNQILIFSQTNTKATVHRDTYSTCISIRRFNEEGKVTGELRVIGLLTSKAYNDNIQNIPLLRQKVAYILERSGLPKRGHASRRLLNILETLPRDSLFEGSVDELYSLATDILHMQERRNVRLFIRKDAYNRYLSCLIYLPKDNFHTELLKKIEDVLKQAFNPIEVSLSQISFQGIVLARIHYTVRTHPKETLKYDLKAIEAKLAEIGRSWRDDLLKAACERFGEEKGYALLEKYHSAFPSSYRDTFSASDAAEDIQHMETLNENCTLAMSFYRSKHNNNHRISFKLFHPHSTIPLSDALPIFENMGLRVIGEEPYPIKFDDGSYIWINNFSMEYGKDIPIKIEEVESIFKEAFFNIWFGHAGNDNFNRLVLSAQLTWREISILRAYAKYLQQTGFPLSQSYIENAFINNPHVARLLVDSFILKFDPEKQIIARDARQLLIQEIQAALDNVVSLDEDRILSRYSELIEVTLRTNFFQTDQKGLPKPYISFKFDSKAVPDLPDPRPLFEIFVFSPIVEGVHLRAGKIARGGLRWSDRFEDFRTEVLGLVKAQQVKNAVIVPEGAKGCFVAKNIPEHASRNEIMEAGISAYRHFICGLLDLTDNLKNNRVIPPQNTVRYDEDDYYLVVAADKGTATFSDYANAIAKEYDFWLDDAFASGGSVGYDHKKMGITARGAWVAVNRHFQEMGMNPATNNFTVVGIGDMSGDVFGNGMLLSEHIQLVAAFNHMHIFLDPHPDPKKSFAERKRLFNLPRSTWDDYDKKLISQGGGVFPRTAKSIPLSPQVKKALGVEADKLQPNQLIQAILKAPVDLLWNGGIGTYVKAANEQNSEVGDRSNDALRVNGKDLRCRAVGEGGNLGFTQLGRIEFELNGGQINTDFIDNSGGVDSSDHEVNIKILLNSLVKAKEINETQRKQLLAKMTDDVAKLVLENNYKQNRAISIARRQVRDYFTLYTRFIKTLEKEGKIDRAIERLPDDEMLSDRAAQHIGLTRPELSILLAYSKILLKEEILNSDIAEKHKSLKQLTHNLFPSLLKEKYTSYIEKHTLSKEIIATQLSNSLINDMGPIFIHQMSEEFNVETQEIITAYIRASRVFDMEQHWKEIDALDHKVDPSIQMDMMLELIRLIRRATRWFMRNNPSSRKFEDTIQLFKKEVQALYTILPNIITAGAHERFKISQQMFINEKVPAALATKIASIKFMHSALNIVQIAISQKERLNQVATVYFKLSDHLNLTWLRERINEFPVDSRWAVLARSAFKGDLDALQRGLTGSLLKLKVKSKNIDEKIDQWLAENKIIISRWHTLLKDIEISETHDASILSVAMRELACLAGGGNG